MSDNMIVLILTGSVAAVKTFMLLDELQRKNIKPSVIATDAAWQFLNTDGKYKPTPRQLRWLKNNIVSSRDAARCAALINGSAAVLVSPASADFISQLAHGSVLADTIHQAQKKIIIVPAMNVMMWQHPATQANIELLRASGVLFAGPADGPMACGDTGYGRLIEPAQIADAAAHALQGRDHVAFHAIKSACPLNTLLPPANGNTVKKILLILHEGSQETINMVGILSQDYDVRCVLTDEANQHLDRAEIEQITGHAPLWQHYQSDPQGMEHIRLPEQSDAVVIASASWKYAHEMALGGAASFAGCIYLATKKPVFVLPSQRDLPSHADIQAIKTQGAVVVNSLNELKEKLQHDAQELAGRHYLVLGGSAREVVDPFRFYGNGKRPAYHGAAVAHALKKRGAMVTFVSPPAVASDGIQDDLNAITEVEARKIVSLSDMMSAVQSFAGTVKFDGIVQCANISSLRCSKPSTRKIQKTGADAHLLFEVEGNLDIGQKLRALFPATPIMGFGTWQEKLSVRPDPVIEKLIADTASDNNSVPSISSLPRPQGSTFQGRRVIVSASRTEETLTEDGTLLTNFFTGKQGYALAAVFADQGADVVLISGPTNLPDPSRANIQLVRVTSAQDIYDASMAAIRTPADAYISCAAIADFKIKKQINSRLAEGESLTLDMVENASVVGHVAAHKTNRPAIVVSFAAQSPETILKYAQAKFEKLGVDMTIANPIGANTVAARNSDMNQIYIITRGNCETVSEMPKDDIAALIASRILIQLQDISGLNNNGVTICAPS